MTDHGTARAAFLSHVCAEKRGADMGHHQELPNCGIAELEEVVVSGQWSVVRQES
jgi:hypothetical protein